MAWIDHSPKPPPAYPAPGTELCALTDIPAIGGKGFVFGQGSERFAMFVIRRNDEVKGYVNECPHVGGPLDWVSDQFLDTEKTHILCATHGARFRIDNGLCISPPCPGALLTPVNVDVSDGMILMGDNQSDETKS
jgi:nitrite reductase/ring-hydroxylating ferredoxin subunit